MELFDTHAHLDEKYYKDILEETIEDAVNNNVKYITIPGYDLKSSQKAVEIAEKYDNIFALVGIHPSEASKYTKEQFDIDLQKIEKLASSNKVVGIGEIGLDNYWTKEYKKEQKYMLIQQINLANKLSLPVALHIREATIDIIDILTEHKVDNTGIFHCVPLNEHLIKEGLKLRYYISFSGNITFKNAKSAPSCVKLVPEDKLLIETDSPYLTPEPNRGKKNKPSYVRFVKNKIAEILEKDPAYISKITTDNAFTIYNIDKNNLKRKI